MKRPTKQRYDALREPRTTKYSTQYEEALKTNAGNQHFLISASVGKPSQLRSTTCYRIIQVAGILVLVASLIAIFDSMQNLGSIPIELLENYQDFYTDDSIPNCGRRHKVSGKVKAMTSDEFISQESGFHPEWHPSKRLERFPSFDERLQIYMGNWYLKPCNDDSIYSTNERLSYRYDYRQNASFPSVIISSISGDKRNITLQTGLSNVDVHSAIWERNVWDQDGNKICSFQPMSNTYCPDMRNIATLAKTMNKKDSLSELPPIIASFGDGKIRKFHKQAIPNFQKVRFAATRENLALVTSKSTGLKCSKVIGPTRITLNTTTSFRKKRLRHVYSPIIWPMNNKRHFDPNTFKQVRIADIPWECKRHIAVWRGQLTGYKASATEGKTFSENCDSSSRCLLVKKYSNSSLLNVGISEFGADQEFGVSLQYMLKGIMSMEEQLQYKMIIVMEGNDVATSLKWAFYSRSLVLMQVPSFTSFAMEEWLEPWTHYVPLKSDLSDAEEKIRWVMEHDEEARKISERATLFIHDLLFHPESEVENKKIKKKLLRHYFRFFI